MATYYVSPSGNDANAGTSGSPWRHASHAANTAASGDSVIFGDGTYDQEGRSGASGYVVPSINSGITFQAANRGGAILDGGNPNPASQTGAFAYFNLGSAANLVFDGFVFQNVANAGIWSTSFASNITVRNCVFRYIGASGVGGAGIYSGETTTNLTVDSCVFHDIGRRDGSTTSLDHALYLKTNGITVVNSTFYNQVDGWDIQLAIGASNIVIANNVFASHNPGQSGQIILWDVAHSNVVFRNNIFVNPPTTAIYAYFESVTGGFADHNLVTSSASVYSGSDMTVGSNLLNVDPLFTNAAGHDYTLTAGSPAIDAGATVSAAATDGLGNSRPSGAGYDIGAYEYVGSATLPAIISLTASPASITSGSTTLNFSAIRATSLSIDNGVGTVTGTSVLVSPSVTTTYQLTATNGTGSVTRDVTVTVAPAGSTPAVLSFTASTPTFSAGQPVTLFFSFANATTASIDNGVGSVAGLSSVVVFPAQTATYTLTVGTTGPGSTSQSVTVFLSPVPIGAVGENIRAHQIRRAERHGAYQILQASDGTGIVRHLAGFLIDGSLTDSGIDAIDIIGSRVQPYHVVFYLPGPLTAGVSEPVMQWTCPSDLVDGVSFAAAFGGFAKGYLQTNPAATATCNIYKVTAGSAVGALGTLIGSIVISTAGVFAFSLTATSFLPGDSMTAWPPGTLDSTLAGVGWTLPGTRGATSSVGTGGGTGGTSGTGTGPAMTVNGTATISINGIDASFDDTVLVNGA